ncbi:Cytoskeleton-associated protein 5 [Oopsacas minuta]|uniref:Cytoskeleton-associated protein 5 n=1 Tax=Oopsacas minuta TaxID=111878 RepID=A0AAV7JXE3_9METZ|nr:Cytoskeleton-associated protein 5 [Oopsacas minuta]
MDSETPPPEEDFSGIPLEDRLSHKNWKARVSGYEELVKKFRILEEDSPEYVKYSYDMKKYVSDTNAAALEKGLDVAAAFLEFAKMEVAGKCVQDIMQGITAKCFNARPKAKEIANNVCLLCVEVEKQDVVIEELIAGCTAKIPKVVIGCIAAITNIVAKFGAHIIQVKILLRGLASPFAHTDKNIRNEAKNLSIELCKWLRADILRICLKDLKPVQLKELEDEWKKVADEVPKPTRFLRSKQNEPDELAATDDQAESGGETTPLKDKSPLFDPLEMVDPIDLRKHYPPDFFELVASAKWSERRDALGLFLEEATKVIKVLPADYSELLTAMHKMITKDTNIYCVQNAAKVVTVLAKGLKGQFEPQAKLFLTAVLEKMKEKKAAVVVVLSECADAIYQTSTMLFLHEEILETLESKNPNVKSETCLFTARCLCYCSPTTLTKPIIKVLVPSLLKRLDDTTPQVRDAASMALGTCLKILGDRPLALYFEDVEKNKRAKIQEASDKAELKVSQGAKKAVTKAKEPAKKEEKQPAKAKEDKAKTAKKTIKTNVTKSTSLTKSTSKTNVTAKAKTSGSKVKTDDFLPNFENEPSYSPEELDAMAQESFGEDILTRLSDSKWRDRCDACTEVKEILETINEDKINSQMYIHVIMVKPGLADGNLQVMNLKFSMIGFLAKRAPDWGSRCTEAVIATLGEKLGEMRLKATSTESLFCISERIQSLHHVALTVMSVCSNHKSPKIQTEGFIWLATALVEFGLKVKLPAFVGYIKTGLASTNPNIKSASLKLLSAFAVFFSTNIDAFKGMLGEINPNIKGKVDKEIQVSTESPPSKPTRSLKPKDADDDSTTDDSSSMNMDDMIPRVDISGNFKGAIMDNLADKKDWRLRNEALEEIKTILKQSPSITPNLGLLPAGLKARLSDSNKNLVCTTLGIIGSLAAKLGPGLTKIVRVLLPAVLNVLTDAKANVREAAILTLNAWHQNLKLFSFFDYEMILTALKTDNPNLRADLMGWISENIKEVPANTLPKTELLAIIPSVGSALEDRAAPVRDKAKQLLLAMVESFGKESVTKASAKAPGQVIKQLLSKIPAQQSTPSIPDNVVEPESAKQPESEPTPTTIVTKTEKSSNVAKVKAAPPPEPEEVKPFKMGPSREQREAEEKKLGSRCPRWEFDQPSTEHIRYVRNQLEKCMDVALLDKMLDNDFQKHEPAIKFIIGTSCLKGPCEREIINCMDLIFKFISMKLSERNNTKILKLSLEFLRVLLELLSDKNYTMSDNEASCIVPFIVQRMGNPNETLRKEVRNIIQLFTHIYTTSKIYMMISVGLVSRNSKLKVDCIEVLGELIRDQGTGVCTPTPQKAIETLAKSISDSDHKTKNAALTCMVYIFNHIGETLFKYVGHIPPKDKDLLQDKIKKYGMAPSSSPVPTAKFELHNSKSAAHSTDNLHEPVPPPPPVENVPEQIEPEPIHDQPLLLASDPLLEPDINMPTAVPQIEPQSYPRSAPSQRTPQLTIPQSAGPFSVDVDSICKKHELVQTTPLSKLIRPTGYEELLKKPTNTTNYQTSVLYARSQYAEDLPAIINYLASQDLGKVDENNRKLEQIIKLQPFQVVDYVNSIIEAALIQFSTCESMLASRSTTDHMLSVLRGILSCLMNVLEIRVLCKKIKQQNLKDLFKHIAHLLTNPGLNTFDEGVQVIRALNLLVALILESVDHNELFTVLLDLMLQSLTREGTPSDTTDIYMKSVWRLTRNLNDNIRLIKVNKLLFDVDQFFIAYTRVGTTPRSEDKLYKTAKTIVFHVANSLDTEVWDYTDLIVKPEQSHVCRTIRNTLNKLSKSQDSSLSSNSDVSIRNTSMHNQDSSISREGEHAKMSPAARFRAQLNQGMEDVGDERVGNQEVNSRLAQIFTRIGAREISGQGLADLYNFMLANPTTDLRPFLKSTSNIFQGYIERGLQSIERDMRNPFKETSKIYQGDIETRSSYLRLRENARRTMDLELPLPPKQATSYSPGLSVNAPREDFNQRNLRQPQSQTAARLSPQDPQQRSSARDMASLRKRLELATNSAATTTQPGVTSAPDKITELRERFSRLQQQNL